MATVFVQTKFGMAKSPLPIFKNDSKIPVLQPAEVQVFDLKQVRSVQASLSKKIQDLQEKRLVGWLVSCGY